MASLTHVDLAQVQYPRNDGKMILPLFAFKNEGLLEHTVQTLALCGICPLFAATGTLTRFNQNSPTPI